MRTSDPVFPALIRATGNNVMAIKLLQEEITQAYHILKTEISYTQRGSAETDTVTSYTASD